MLARKHRIQGNADGVVSVGERAQRRRVDAWVFGVLVELRIHMHKQRLTSRPENEVIRRVVRDVGL